MRYDKLVNEAMTRVDLAVTADTRQYLAAGTINNLSASIADKMLENLGGEDVIQILAEDWPSWAQAHLPHSMGGSFTMDHVARAIIRSKLYTLIYHRIKTGPPSAADIP